MLWTKSTQSFRLKLNFIFFRYLNIAKFSLPQMLLIFVPLLLLEIFSTYFFINLICFTVSDNLTSIIIDITFWDLFLVVPPHVAILFCFCATRNADKLARHLEKFSNSCSDDMTVQKLNHLLSKLYKRKIVFSCGFFNINLQLGLSIVSTVMTYMVIIFQFQISDRAK